MWPSSSSCRRGASPTPPPHTTGTTQRHRVHVSTTTRAVSAPPTDAASSTMAPTSDRVVSIRTELRNVFGTAIKAAYPNIDSPPIIAIPSAQQAAHCDYQCNNAMSLFGRLKKSENPPASPAAVAEAIIAAMPQSEVIGNASVSGAGFIGIRLSRSFLASRLSHMLANGMGCWAPQLPYRKVVVDFSSPNVAKEMHVGHLRSTIIGDTLARAIEYCQVPTVRLNHIGDWGTQFGMLIQYMQEKRPEGLGNDGGKEEDVADLQELYRAAKARFDEDEEFKQRARVAVTELQGGKPEYVAAWKRICAASRREFQAIYERLGVELEERGESYYNPALKSLVEELEQQGVAEESEGCSVVFVKGQEVPLMLRKSDGGYGYATTDMAAIRQRLQEEQADWIIYVTDAGQQQHFQTVFAAARKAGWLPDDPKKTPLPRVDHVGFGVVLGEDGKKFKTRSGDVVRLVDLLDEAKRRTQVTLKERDVDFTEEQFEMTSRAMGYGAIKYADLKSNRTTNYRFSYDDMLSMQGNTAVYLLYAHARIAQILIKSGRDPLEIVKSGAPIKLDHDKEVALALHLCRFPEFVEDLVELLMPNRITEYLYDLSGIFNSFYADCKVVGSDSEDSRLQLCEATAVVMRQCFALLGITPLYRI